ncbi:MAG: aerotolerance regulator BatA [Candidatus Aenigmarchaeota archaeon ex4484_52]|nr:MAG: aerotolerance regulator BatA [Candidatus Aenigmarchaeota archaeon ex4484_52]
MIFSFGEPIILILLLIVPFIIYFYKIYIKKKKQNAIKFSSIKTIKQVSPNKNIRLHLPFILILTAIILIIIGLADPNIPLKTTKKGVNVVLVLDDSGSMAATDYKPTRLDVAKESAKILINSLKQKDNVGIIIFESGATTASYLTPFKNKAIEKLEAIEQKQGRTAIGDGLSLAVDMAISIPNKKKVIILLSDGVNNAGVINPQESTEFAKTNNIQVYTIGMGSDQPVILGYDFFGQPQYAELDEKTLREIAEQTGGKYFKSVNKNTLEEIYKNIGKDIEREWENTSIKNLFFATALVLLLIDFYIIYCKYRIIV